MSEQQMLGTEVAGYRIESVIGRGGMAVVYRAEDTRLGRKVALKIMTSALSDQPQFQERFVRESRLAASLDHPNIIPVYEAGNAHGTLFIAMRYVVGADLKAVLRETGILPADRVLHLVEQLCDALDAAHELGLVHRDVKPGNVLLTSPRRHTDHAYLTDFGLTKRMSSLTGGLTVAGNFLGTIDYVAPEQIAGKPVDGRTDIYALGCVLYECLTGRVPFGRDDDAATLWAHLIDTPPPVTAARPDLPPAVNAVVARAMAKSPDARYQTCQELVVDLIDALSEAADVTRLPSTNQLHPGMPQLPTDPGSEHPSFPSGSFPPGTFSPLPSTSPRALQPRHRAEAQNEDDSDESFDDGSGWPPATDFESESDEDWDGDRLPPLEAPRRSFLARYRWILAAVVVVVAVAAAAAVALLRDRTSGNGAVQTYVSGSQFAGIAPLTAQVPTSWIDNGAPDEGKDVTLSTDDTNAMARLLTLPAQSGTYWAQVRKLLGQGKGPVGMWIYASDVVVDLSSWPDLQQAVKQHLPPVVTLGHYTDQTVGGMSADEALGRLTDPDDPGTAFDLLIDVVQYTKNGGGQVLVLFFAPSGEMPANRTEFTRVRDSITFP
jgi:serine/threonine protein kinase